MPKAETKNKEAEKTLKPKRKPPIAKLKKPVKLPKEKKAAAENKYYEAVGRRKTAIARVRLFPAGSGVFMVNGQDYRKYFLATLMQQTAISPMSKLNPGPVNLQVHTQGGGIKAQAEATRLGVSRALVKFLPDLDKELKKLGYMTRDPRMRERKKFGFKRARKAPQWAKR